MIRPQLTEKDFTTLVRPKDRERKTKAIVEGLLGRDQHMVRLKKMFCKVLDRSLSTSPRDPDHFAGRECLTIGFRQLEKSKGTVLTLHNKTVFGKAFFGDPGNKESRSSCAAGVGKKTMSINRGTLVGNKKLSWAQSSTVDGDSTDET
jgi:hypothetical protein